MTLETKAGLITVLGIAAVLVAVFFLRGGVTFRERGYPIYVIVTNATGVTVGAPVQMAGIEIGRVQRLDLTAERKARITVLVRYDRSIPTGSRFAIATSGLLGDRFITITPGPTDAPPIPPNTTVIGADPFTVEQLFDRVVAVARQAEDALANINRLIGDPQLGAGLSEAIRNARETTVVMRQVAENVERTTRTLDRTLAGEVPQIAGQLRDMAADLADAAREVRTLARDVAGDGQTSRQIRDTVGALQRASQGMDKMVRDLQGVINEPQVRAVRASLAEAQTAISEARQAVGEVRQGVGEARAVIKRADQVVDRVGRIVPERIELPDLRTSYRLEYELWYGGGRVGHDVIFTLLPDAPRRYIFAWRDLGGANRFGLQVGQRLENAPMILRYGLIDSQPGVGLDYGMAPGPVYSVDLSNINQLTLNVYAHYFAQRDWGISLRATNLLLQPTFGFGYFRRF
ncbi:MAG: MCE family protein [Armatimonadetes bacterium]|nr:MCE family protein [Armatimonadota bacterium]